MGVDICHISGIVQPSTHNGLSKAAVLAALYNAALPKGLGFSQYDPRPITEEEAEEIILLGDDNRREFGPPGREFYTEYCFDYVYGRALKVELTYDEVLTYAYNENNGEGMAERAVKHLRETGEVYSEDILKEQQEKILEEAFKILDDIDSGPSSGFVGDNVYRLGFDQHAEELREVIQKIAEQLPE